MGLDQSLRVIKPVEKKYLEELSSGIIYCERYYELDDILNFKSKEDMEEDFHKSLHKFAVPCKVEGEFLNIQKALEDTYPGIDVSKLESCMTSFHDDVIEKVYENSETGDMYELVIDDDFESKYSFKQVNDMYAFSINTEAAYWRKDFNLRHYMEYKFGFGEQNCYYFPLSEKQVNTLIKDLEDVISDVHNKRLQGLFGFREKDLKDLGESTYIDRARYTLRCFNNALDCVDFSTEALCYHEWY